MAGLFLVHGRDPTFAEGAMAAARAQFVRHGFAAPFEREIGGWRLLHTPHVIAGPDSLLVRGDDIAAVAGTFTCDGKMGTPALVALIEMIASGGQPDWTRIGGQFVAFVHAGGRNLLFTDYFAAFQVYHDADQRLFSTSLLSAAQALPRLQFDAQSVYEFAFNVVPVGNDTVLAELKRLGPDEIVSLGPEGARSIPTAKPLPEELSTMPEEERIALHRDRLRAIVRPHVEAFGDKMFCPLSGGIDSRLVLAALRAEGCRPSIYVYGDETGEDVRIARAIGAAEGFHVEWFDKDGYAELAPDAFPEQVARNFHDYDALPNYGGLFDNGGNAAARRARHAGGALAASGGCGEIYRNFFFLPDRSTSAAGVARSFFARYDPGDATERFDGPAFLRSIEDKILAAIGRPGDRGPLPRPLIEQIYPRVRCRSLFGKEISDEGRHAAYLMPFLDHQVVAAAMTLPLAQKNAGRFEARLLHAIDPALAARPSAYGHDFAGPPNARHRLAEWSTRMRPAWLRQRSYRLQRRLGPMGDEHGGLLTPEYLGRVIDLDYPAMRRFFRIERIGDSGMMRRIACLEYLAGFMGGRLAG